jgi:hypothetical protein
MSFSKFIVPLFSTIVLLLSDFALYICFTKTEHWGKTEPWGQTAMIIMAVYNFFLIMALWSLFATWCGDPGYIKRGSVYNIDNMSALMREIYTKIVLYQADEL